MNISPNNSARLPRAYRLSKRCVTFHQNDNPLQKVTPKLAFHAMAKKTTPQSETGFQSRNKQQNSGMQGISISYVYIYITKHNKMADC